MFYSFCDCYQTTGSQYSFFSIINRCETYFLNLYLVNLSGSRLGFKIHYIKVIIGKIFPFVISLRNYLLKLKVEFIYLRLIYNKMVFIPTFSNITCGVSLISIFYHI
jgi:hypothetical protein